MATKEKLRIGFVGTGTMGQAAHLRNYVAIGDCRVVALAELREGVGKEVALRNNIEKVYTEAADMLAAEDLDAIVAAQPFNRHGILLTEILKAGKPVFIEKPLSSNLEVGERLVQLEKESGTFIMVGYHKRSDPAIMYAKQKVEAFKVSGELGRLKYVRVRVPMGDWIANGFTGVAGFGVRGPKLEVDPDPADMDPATNAKFQAFTNFYIHQVNLLRHFFGENYKITHVSKSEVVMTVESESGIDGVIEMNPYAATVDWPEQVLVCFEKGYVKVDLPAPLASFRPGNVELLVDPGNGATPETIVPKMPWVHAMRQQAINFCAAVRGESAPPCGAAEAYEDLKTAREYIKVVCGK